MLDCLSQSPGSDGARGGCGGHWRLGLLFVWLILTLDGGVTTPKAPDYAASDLSNVRQQKLESIPYPLLAPSRLNCSLTTLLPPQFSYLSTDAFIK